MEWLKYKKTIPVDLGDVTLLEILDFVAEESYGFSFRERMGENHAVVTIKLPKDSHTYDFEIKYLPEQAEIRIEGKMSEKITWYSVVWMLIISAWFLLGGKEDELNGYRKIYVLLFLLAIAFGVRLLSFGLRSKTTLRRLAGELEREMIIRINYAIRTGKIKKVDLF